MWGNRSRSLAIVAIAFSLAACEEKKDASPEAPQPQPQLQSNQPDTAPEPQAGAENASIRLAIDLDLKIHSIVRGKDGTFFIAGNTRQTFDTRAKTSSAYVAQVDASGKILWADITDSTRSSSIFKLVSDPKGNLIAAGNSGGLGGEALVARYERLDGKYSRVWSKRFGSVARDVAVDRSGNAYVVGSTTKNMLGEQHPGRDGRYNAFVTKLDPSGEEKWTYLSASSAGKASEALSVVVNERASKPQVYVASVEMGENFKYFLQSGQAEALVQRINGVNGKPVWKKLLTPGQSHDAYVPIQLIVQKDRQTGESAIHLCGNANQGIHEGWGTPMRQDGFLVRLTERTEQGVSKIAQDWVRVISNDQNTHISNCRPGADEGTMDLVNWTHEDGKYGFPIARYNAAGQVVGEAQVKVDGAFSFGPDPVLLESEHSFLYLLGVQFGARGTQGKGLLHREPIQWE